MCVLGLPNLSGSASSSEPSLSMTRLLRLTTAAHPQVRSASGIVQGRVGSFRTVATPGWVRDGVASNRASACDAAMRRVPCLRLSAGRLTLFTCGGEPPPESSLIARTEKYTTAPCTDEHAQQRPEQPGAGGGVATVVRRTVPDVELWPADVALGRHARWRATGAPQRRVPAQGAAGGGQVDLALNQMHWMHSGALHEGQSKECGRGRVGFPERDRGGPRSAATPNFHHNTPPSTCMRGCAGFP